MRKFTILISKELQLIYILLINYLLTRIMNGIFSQMHHNMKKKRNNNNKKYQVYGYADI